MSPMLSPLYNFASKSQPFKFPLHNPIHLTHAHKMDTKLGGEGANVDSNWIYELRKEDILGNQKHKKML